MSTFFHTMLEPQELTEILRRDHHLFAAYAARKHVVIAPAQPRGNVKLIAPTETFCDMLTELSGMTLVTYEAEFPAKDLTKPRMTIELSTQEADAFWTMISKEWYSFSSYFVDNTWEWISYPNSDGMSLVVTGFSSLNLERLGEMISHLIGEMKFDVRPVIVA